ncbi:MAG: dihydrolipoyl dehydrogenase [Burkholderiales bacterium]
MKAYDVAVIGAGPGGYVAAIRCAQLGLKTVCIDDREKGGKPAPGGTCLNVGCIPSKALLESSENYEKARMEFASHGILISEMAVDLAKMQARKSSIVDAHTNGISFLFRKNRVESILGRARLKAIGEHCVVEVAQGDRTERLEAKHVIIATGSSPRKLEGAIFGNRVVDSSGALAFEEIPKKLGIIGAGVIGLELGSVWRRLGSEVTLLEASPEFLPLADEKISKEALRQFRKEAGWTINLGVKVISVREMGSSVKVIYENTGGTTEKDFDKLIVATGRIPNSKAVADDNLGLNIDDRGFIEVDRHCKTNLPNVYAVGDVVQGAMLAHKASEEGVMVAELIDGQKPEVDPHLMPWVIYTSPEIAWVGKTELQLKSEGIEYRAGQFPFSANGRAQALGDARGFVKMLADANTDRVLGVHIIGPFASELISEAVVAMAFSASSEDIARTIHAHPSLCEALHEASLAVEGRALHI